jgi:hypothetical protein
MIHIFIKNYETILSWQISLKLVKITKKLNFI